MAFFEGGKIPLIGVTPQNLANTTSKALISVAQNQINQATGQVFQGSGQSFLAGAGQTIVSEVATNVLKVGLNSVLGSQITGVSGIDLSSGGTILASVITPSVTSGLSSLINQGISNSLQSAGPFGPVLSQIGTTVTTGLISSLFGGLGGGGAGAATPAVAGGGNTGNKRFPGAGDEPKADYGGGGTYTLGSNGSDVVFSLQPANQGPQLSGQNSQEEVPKSATTQAVTQQSEVTNNVGTAFKTDNNGKIESMLPGATNIAAGGRDFTKVFDPNSKVGSPEQVELAYGGARNPAWTFICAPEDISWDLANATNRIDMFGTNNPPVVAGTKGMRNLSIGNAVVEGFTRGVTVEYKVEALEQLMNYSLNTSDGFVSVPVYQFWANKKQYGGASPGEGGYFLIKDVKVTEKLRDLKGYTTRATVDISLIQVPKYQVNSGRDQAGKTTAGVKSRFISQADQNNINAARGVAGQAQQKGNSSGPNVPQNPGGGTGNNPQNTPPVSPSRDPSKPRPFIIPVLGNVLNQ